MGKELSNRCKREMLGGREGGEGGWREGGRRRGWWERGRGREERKRGSEGRGGPVASEEIKMLFF